jgi:molybdopterin synthase sulfur carrier subunit
MPVKVLIPTQLRKLTGELSQLDDVLPNATLIGMIDALERRFPGIKTRLVDDTGELRRFVAFYVNGEDIRFLQRKETLLKEGDEVSIIPAVAGG